MTEPAVATVGRVEAELLGVARALVTPGAYPSVEHTLATPHELTTLGPTAMRILESTLAKGSVKMLARLGGARRAHRVLPIASRPPPGLAFSAYSFQLVRWLTCTRVGDPSAATFDATPLTIGDELLSYLTLRLVEDHPLARPIAAQPGLHASALAWLGYAGVLARHGRIEEPVVPAFEKLLDDADERGTVVLECIADDLRRRWAIASASPVDAIDPARAVRIVLAEQRTLNGFLDAVERKGRWELATFLVEAGARVLPGGAVVRDVAARVVPIVREGGALRARTEARRKAGALFHALRRLGEKRDELALVRFFEDGYDDAQRVLAAWDVLGKDGFSRAEEVVRELDALPDPGAGAEAAAPST